MTDTPHKNDDITAQIVSGSEKVLTHEEIERLEKVKEETDQDLENHSQEVTAQMVRGTQALTLIRRRKQALGPKVLA